MSSGVDGETQGEATMTLLPTPAFNTSVFLPTGELDENRAIDYVAALISRVRPGMEKEYGREWLETELQKGLREGLLTPAIYAVKAANAGDEIYDAEHGRYWAVKRRVIRLILSPVKWALLALKVSGKSPPRHFGFFIRSRLIRSPHRRGRARSREFRGRAPWRSTN